jgi:N-acetylmuramoyl-L-alanine amidase
MKRQIPILTTFILVLLIFIFVAPLKHNAVEAKEVNFTSAAEKNIKRSPFKGYDGGSIFPGVSTKKDEPSTKSYLTDKYKGKSIVIDPGHGGSDDGACFEDIYEKNIVLDISLKLGIILEQTGMKVVYTRQEDKYISLRKRIDIANNEKVDIFVSVHCNSFDDSSQKGTVTLYDAHNKPNLKSKILDFAKIVQKNVVEGLGTNDAGVIYRPELYVLNTTKMPAILVEAAFLSNAEDREKLINDDYRQKTAEAVAKGIEEFLDK